MLTLLIISSTVCIILALIILISEYYIPKREEAELSVNRIFTIYYCQSIGEVKEKHKAHIEACCKECAITQFWSEYLSDEGIYPADVKILSVHKGA